MDALKLLEDMNELLTDIKREVKMRTDADKLRENSIKLARSIEERVSEASLDETVTKDDKADIFSAWGRLNVGIRRTLKGRVKIEEVKTQEDLVKNLGLIASTQNTEKM